MTDGEVRIRIYPDAQLGTQRESMELMQNGALDMVKSNAAELKLSPCLRSIQHALLVPR